MSLRRTPKSTPEPEPAPATCTACGHQGALLARVVLPGFPDSPALLCSDPTACRRRAVAAGLWKAA